MIFWHLLKALRFATKGFRLFTKFENFMKQYKEYKLTAHSRVWLPDYIVVLVAASASASVASASMSFFVVMMSVTMVAAFGIWVII